MLKEKSTMNTKRRNTMNSEDSKPGSAKPIHSLMTYLLD